MSGHNKWSKVKHKKAATDAKKSKLFSKHARFIAVEAKKAAGSKDAPGLRAAIERARADFMPNDNIDRAVTKGMGTDGAVLEEIVYEGYGPGGVALLIVTQTDNKNRTSQEMRHLLSKNGYALGTPGSAAWAFIKKGHGYAPTAVLELSEKDGALLAELIEQFEDHDDVQDVYTAADEIEHAS